MGQAEESRSQAEECSLLLLGKFHTVVVVLASLLLHHGGGGDGGGGNNGRLFLLHSFSCTRFFFQECEFLMELKV